MAAAVDCQALEAAGVELLWGDSLGAKSLAFRVGGVLVDPGAAAMHPGYPLPGEEKARLRVEALERVARAAEGAGLVVVSHYHYDHYARPWLEGHGFLWRVYEGKTIVVKDPNLYVNASQWERARRLVGELAARAGLPRGEALAGPDESRVKRAVEALGEPPGAREAEWLGRLAGLWRRGPWVRSPLRLPGLSSTLIAADEGVFEDPASGVVVRLLGPRFHGRPWERTGWVVPLLVERGGWRVLYTSDLMGPLHGAYAGELARLRPHAIIADGPPAYMAPYRFPRRLVAEALDNAERLAAESGASLLVYDHHLARMPGWTRLLRELAARLSRRGVEVASVADCLGRRPPIE